MNPGRLPEEHAFEGGADVTDGKACYPAFVSVNGDVVTVPPGQL